ncbi:hypothetical protein MTO96_041567 [Rhipicephalus appendiculatus]
MLIRLSILLATCALSLTAEVAVEDKNDDNPFPKWLIEVGSHVNESDTAIYSTRRPRVTGKVKGGTICLNTEECGVGKCCLRRGKDPRRKCRRYQRIGQRCTDDQMMGGYYQNYCPCNRHSICAVVGHVLKCVKRQPIQRPQGPRPTPPPEEKESKESEEISTRPGGASEEPVLQSDQAGVSGNTGVLQDLRHLGIQEEPPEESKEAEGPEAPPVGSGGRGAQRLPYHVSGGGGSAGRSHPETS